MLRVAFIAGFLALLLAAAVTYYLVEAPMRRLGRRLAARLTRAPGPAAW